MRGLLDPPRTARRAVSAAFAAQGLGFSVLVTHLPQFSDRYGLDDASVTLTLLLVTVLAGAGSVASEVLAHRRSSRAALRLALLGVAASLAWVTLAPSFATALVGFAGYGLAVGGVDASANMQGVAVQQRYGRSVISSFHAWWSAAAIAGALYVAAGERLNVPLAGSVLPIAAAVLLILVLAGPSLLPGEELPADDLPADDLPAADLHAQGLAAEQGLPAERLQGVPLRPLLLLGAALTCFWAVDSGIANWSSLFLDDTLHAGSAAALGYAAYQSTALASRLAGDRVVQRAGAAWTVRAAAATACAGLLVVVAAPDARVAVAGFLLTGAGLPVVAPLCFSAMAGATRAAGGGSAAIETGIARLNVFNYAGSLIGAAVIGGVGSAASLRAGFGVALLLAAGVAASAPAFSGADAG